MALDNHDEIKNLRDELAMAALVFSDEYLLDLGHKIIKGETAKGAVAPDEMKIARAAYKIADAMLEARRK